MTTNATLVRKIERGIATLLDLTSGGATRLGVGGDDYAPCTDDGQNCAGDIYAVSCRGDPSRNITWFQAQEACASSGKRLPTSAEWQVGADGTPDPRAGQSGDGLQQRKQRRVGHRFPQRVHLRTWGLRHGGQLEEWVRTGHRSRPCARAGAA
jgi:formylglycine-generating enzyme required for sulfatase activity